MKNMKNLYKILNNEFLVQLVFENLEINLKRE
jgi:hypothetical protein